LVTVSDFIRDLAIEHGVPADRVRTIRNTMTVVDHADPDARRKVRGSLSIPDDAFVLGNVSRLSPGKGHSDLLQAFARAAGQRPSAYLVIAGDGDIRAQVEAEALSLGLGRRVQCLGQRRDVPNLLSSFDAFIHPSRMDPAPLAVLEASGAGLPVIAYREGGVCDFVEQGKTGLLSAPGSVDELAQSVGIMLDDVDLVRRMGSAAKERIAFRFRPEDAGAEFADLVRSFAA